MDGSVAATNRRNGHRPGITARKILARFAVPRTRVAEGVKTSSVVPTTAEELLRRLAHSDLASATVEARAQLLSELQAFLVERVRGLQNSLRPTFNSNLSTREFISDLLKLAGESGKRGLVAKYLVGAKLQLRFPEMEVRNEKSSASDDSSGQPGDFVLGDTTFHVAVAPTPAHFAKCRQNLHMGLRVFLLVPDDFVFGARQNADLTAEGQIAVESIESFVAQNIEEISKFSRNAVVDGLRRLLEMYNTRVNAAGIDKTMMIEIPSNLPAMTRDATTIEPERHGPNEHSR